MKLIALSEDSKTCCHCGETKPLAEFHFDSRRTDGRRSRCKVCGNAANRASKKKHPEKVRAGKARWASENRERLNLKSRERYMKNRAQILPRICAARRERWRSDPIWALGRKISSGVRSSLRGDKRRSSWELLVGYSLDELRLHLERQFLKGMNWENVSDWHVDHIVPLSSFSISGPDDPELRRAWALSNLRPLWAKDNLRKWCKRTHLL